MNHEARKIEAARSRTRIYKKYNGRCAYCGELLSQGWQVDHIYPKYRGGSDDESNLNPACRPCNNRKATFTVDEFREELLKGVGRLRRGSPRFRMLERFRLIQPGDSEVVFLFEDYGNA